MTTFLRSLAAALALAGLLPAAVGAGSSAPAPRAAKAPLPVANFLVEWRLHAVDAAAVNGAVVIGSGNAATGTSGFGPGAVVVGTARPAAPQAVRVTNGKEASLQFDAAQTRRVYDLSWSAQSETTGGDAAAPVRGQSRAGGAASHEVTLHRVDGLRVTPRWTRGDTLQLDLALLHGAPAPNGGDADADSRTTRDLAFRSTVQVSIDEWQTVARVGDGTQEMQVRVSWR